MDVKEFLNNLKAKFPHLWWPSYLFHHTDVLNAVSILETGFLYSRSTASDSGVIKLDSAGKGVIKNSPSDLLDYARLYFRPKTPTLYHIEGFAPHGNAGSKYNAHCPVPIYLIFDACRVFSLPDVKFSGGNLASSREIPFSDPDDLAKLNFVKIYHTGPIPGSGSEKASIVKNRCAEVIVPKCLPIDGHLLHILCRSVGERETLLNMLKPSLQNKYENKVHINAPCFYRHKHFIEEVVLNEKEVRIGFVNHSAGFTYKYIFEFNGEESSREYDYPVYEFRWTAPPNEYTVAIYIDDHIAYLGKYKRIASPL